MMIDGSFDPLFSTQKYFSFCAISFGSAIYALFYFIPRNKALLKALITVSDYVVIKLLFSLDSKMRLLAVP